jgi:hypothetical protein
LLLIRFHSYFAAIISFDLFSDAIFIYAAAAYAIAMPFRHALLFAIFAMFHDISIFAIFLLITPLSFIIILILR